MSSRSTAPEKRPGFFAQLRSLYTFTKAEYTWLPWALIGAVVVVLAIVYWFVSSGTAPDEKPVASEPAAATAPAAPAATEPAAPAATTAPAAEAPAAGTAPAAEAPAAGTAPAEPAPATGTAPAAPATN